MKYSRYTYTINQLIQAVNISFSIRETLKNLGLNASGGAYKTINKNIEENNINISHFKGSGWLAGKTHNFSKSIPLAEILNGLHPQYHSFKLKNRLIKTKMKMWICENCNLTVWQNGPIPLELDHVDGNSKNHKLNNLRLLCPNCHALTCTHAGKNKVNKW